MKKFFTLALALVSTISMFATVQSDLVLVFGQGTREIESYITVDDAASVPAAGDYASSLVQDGNIDMYLNYQGKQFSTLTAPSIVNVPVVVITSIGATQDNYSFYVETYDETQLITITDLRPKSGYPVPYTFNLADAAEYEFSLENEYVDGTHTVVADRFILNYNPSAFVTSVTTNEDGWASFAYTADVTPAYPAGLQAYKGALDLTDPAAPEIHLTAVSAIPASEGVFVKGAPLTTYYFNVTTAAALSDNDIVGCTTATDPAGISDAIYTLRNVGGVTALYHYEGTAAIPAGKAYLPIPVGSNPAPQRVRMVINEAQGMENVVVERVKAEKFVENGQILIKRGNEVYNLQGQIVK